MKEKQFSKVPFITLLISRKLCTTLSTEQAAALATWEAESKANRDLSNELSDMLLLQQELVDFASHNASQAFERVSQRIRLRDALTAYPMPVKT